MGRRFPFAAVQKRDAVLAVLMTPLTGFPQGCSSDFLTLVVGER